MTQVEPTPIATHPYPARMSPKGSVLLHLLRTTDPKDIAILYLVTSFVFFMVGGLMAMLMRAELAQPGLQFLSNEQYNQLFTMHGTIMLFLFATPFAFGLANYIVPLQIGAPDMAFPRLQRPLLLVVPVRRAGHARPVSSPRAARPTSAGSPTPRSPNAIHSPGPGADLWIMGSGPRRVLGHSSARSTSSPPSSPARTGHGHVPHADLLLEHLRHRVPDPAGVPGAHRGAAGLLHRPAPRGALLRPGQRRRRSSGSTCSGSSATPRSTSSPCPTSGSSPRSSPSSAASRSSATRA